MPLNVDLKRDTADATVALLRRMGAEERVCLASFQVRDDAPRARARLSWPDRALARRGRSPHSRFPRPSAAVRWRMRAHRAQLPVSLGRPWVIARMKALGSPSTSGPSTIPTSRVRLVALGADGIMTNDPRRIVPALRV